MPFFWHHGGDDSQCRFHGLHIHIVAYSETKLCDVYAYKVLKKVCQKYQLDLKCQKIKHLEALLHHLQEEPRFLLSCNNLSLCARLKKTRGPNPFYAGLELIDFHADDNNEVVQRMDDGGTFVCDVLKYKEQRAPPKMSEVIDRLARQTETIDGRDVPFNCVEQVESSNLKESKTAKNVEILKRLMTKYNRTNEEELLREIMTENDPQDLVTFRVLFTGPYIRTIHAQAIQEMRVEKELNGYTYVDKFIDECPSPVDCLSVEETAALHL